MRRLVIGIIALVTAVLSAPLLASAACAFAELANHPSAQHVPVGSPAPASINDVSERGPPVARDLATNHDAVDSWSHGASPRLDGTTPHVTFTYELAGRRAQAARDSRGVEERSGGTEPEAAVVPRLDVAANAGRFELTALGSSRYQTPAGMIYGPSSKHGHRLTHVLQHGFPDATKKTHSVFTSGSGALRTVDEAWLMRGAPDPSDLGKYVIPMGRTVGTGGETRVTVIVRPGTSQIITAYPSP